MNDSQRRQEFCVRGRLRNLTLVGVLGVLSMIAVLAPQAGAQDAPVGVATENPVLVDGGPIAGSTNGIYFDADNNLWIASVFGRTITKINPETGAILEVLDETHGVFAPDDLVIGPDGSIYWTEIVTGSVIKRTPTGDIVVLVQPGGLQNANPITLTDDGRLFAAGCYNVSLGIFEIDPVNGGIIDTVRDGDPGCASNAMDFLGSDLYSPRPYEDRIVRVDIVTGDLTDITTGWAAPISVKFNSMGELYAGAQGTGEVIRVDLDNPDTTANREVIATFPIGWIDNLAFDENDRLYVSSASDGGIVEIEDGGNIRVVSPGVFTVPSGLGIIGDDLMVGNSAQLLNFDKRTGELNSVFRSVAGLGPLPFMTSMATAGDQVVGMDFFFGQFALVDRQTGTTTASVPMPAPADAHGFRGDIIVTDFGTGQVLRVSTDDLTDQQTLATLAVPVGVAGDDQDIFVSVWATGEIVQIIDNGVVLTTPRVIASGLAGPEGLTLHDGGRSLLVVEGASETLTQVDIATGEKSTVANGFEFFSGNAVLPFGFLNDVESDGEAIFVAADRGNAIHRFETCAGMTEAQADAAGYVVDDRSAAVSGQTIIGTANRDWIVGSEFNDNIQGRAKGDAICSRGGKDVVNGNWGPDIIDGGQDRDILRGGRGNDVLRGEHGWDLLFGGWGADVLDGGVGRDLLRAGRGHDRLTGGLNADRMWGGRGFDVCTDVTTADTARSCRFA